MDEDTANGGLWALVGLYHLPPLGIGNLRKIMIMAKGLIFNLDDGSSSRSDRRKFNLRCCVWRDHCTSNPQLFAAPGQALKFCLKKWSIPLSYLGKVASRGRTHAGGCQTCLVGDTRNGIRCRTHLERSFTKIDAVKKTWTGVSADFTCGLQVLQF